ncbi:B-cell linker protein isoform X2 [Halichoeres trimaculatus]|uniref:B-cell linker protein isoform X2 n=1 Tax=Halichoeres trimaculatus TaxID=147232 RepID=UPI003D9E4FC5
MNLPSREECEGWDHAQVALFMSKNKMPDCANVVNRLRINGKKLLNLSSTDMSKFSIIHQPQLQKIVQDIKKNDGSLLDKLKRLKSKPVPKVPARDYRAAAEDSDDQTSDPDYDNETYEVPEEHDDSYMPPPSHRDFTKPPPVSYPRGEYLDNCHNRPQRPPKPFHHGKQLPPEPPQVESDEEDYINPDCPNDDDNYVEPEENPRKPVQQGGSRTGRELFRLPPPFSGTLNPGVKSVSDKEEGPVRLPGTRLCSTPPKHSLSLPPKPGPRTNMKTPVAVQEPTGEDEYEVCDPSDESPPKVHPKPLPRERSPKPPVKPRPGVNHMEFESVKPREFESRTLPVKLAEPKPPPRPFTLDMKQPKIPLPHVAFPRAADRGSVSAEDEPANPDKDADVYRKPWYANTCDRKTAYEVLYQTNKDGAFMVRKSSGQDTQQPYTLVVFYKGRVYNIPIRFIPANKQYALGSEKKGEEYFNSVAHIIENHKRTPLVLIDSQSNSKDSTKLCHPVKP